MKSFVQLKRCKSASDLPVNKPEPNNGVGAGDGVLRINRSDCGYMCEGKSRIMDLGGMVDLGTLKVTAYPAKIPRRRVVGSARYPRRSVYSSGQLGKISATKVEVMK